LSHGLASDGFACDGDVFEVEDELLCDVHRGRFFDAWVANEDEVDVWEDFAKDAPVGPDLSPYCM